MLNRFPKRPAAQHPVSDQPTPPSGAIELRGFGPAHQQETRNVQSSTPEPSTPEPSTPMGPPTPQQPNRISDGLYRTTQDGHVYEFLYRIDQDRLNFRLAQINADGFGVLLYAQHRGQPHRHPTRDGQASHAVLTSITLGCVHGQQLYDAIGFLLYLGYAAVSASEHLEVSHFIKDGPYWRLPLGRYLSEDNSPGHVLPSLHQHGGCLHTANGTVHVSIRANDLYFVGQE